jgi:hypothetical protein
MNSFNLRRRTILALVGSATVLTSCFYDRFFDLEWDEEVQLHDGRVIVVHIKHRYMRIEQGLTRYSGVSIPIDSTLTLNTNSSAGTVVQYFKGFRPIFLDHYEGVWYAVLRGKYYPGVRETPGQNWGEGEGPNYHHTLHIANGKWQPIRLCDFPDKFKKPNIVQLLESQARPSESSAQRFAVYQNKRITLVEKQQIDVDSRNGTNTISIERAHNRTCQTTSTTSKEISK